MAKSPWGLIANASIEFSRTLTTRVEASTGNEVADTVEKFVSRAYFKKTSVANDEGAGVPVGTYPIQGYTVGILPDWCKESTQSALPCSIDYLGSGLLNFQGKIHVVKTKVEKAGKGTQIQGFFTLQGSN